MDETVTIYKEGHVLRPLIRLLDDFLLPGSPNPITEIIYLHQMSEIGTMPGEMFYPHAIITYMQRRHREVQNISVSEFCPARKFICQYHEDGRLRVYEFSSTMLFYADVIILIFLYLYHTLYGAFPLELFNLSLLMVFKYEINDPVSHDDTNEGPTKITFKRVHHSFQSVALWMYNYVPEFTAFVRSVFPGSTFPPMVGASYFPLILSLVHPPGTYFYLLNVNLALRAVGQPLSLALEHQSECRKWYDVYTNIMRLDICEKLGIVTCVQNGMYKYTPTFYKRPELLSIAVAKINDARVSSTETELSRDN